MVTISNTTLPPEYFWSGRTLDTITGVDKTREILFSISIVLCIALVWLSARPKLKVPILLSDTIKSKKQRVHEYAFPNQVFGIDTKDGTKVVIPLSFLDNLKSHPHLSFKACIDNVSIDQPSAINTMLTLDQDMLLEYTLLGGPPEYVIHAIRGSLTPSLRKLDACGNIQFCSTSSWTCSARAFHGDIPSQNPEWLEVTTGYVVTVFDSIKALKKWPPYLRPIANRLLPYRAKIDHQWAKARKILAASLKQKASLGGKAINEPPSLFDHLTSEKSPASKESIDKQLIYQMTLVAVGTMSTFSTVVQCIYDLAGFPDFIAGLREEALSCPRDEDGLFDKDSLNSLKKLDSFIKESLRLSSGDLTTFHRAATADLTLPDGTFIPKGTKIETNTCAIHADNTKFENATSFDGLRFYKYRQKPAQEHKHTLVAVTPNDLAFGFGKHACPGRYFSQIVIKIFLAEFLINYDVKCLPGQSRPKNLEFEAMVDPDPEAKVMLKSINTHS
ncbi:hypothetical protein AOCH_000445 [Aspergillus ochraceoroseus]|uniref:Cytochrome P450 monooxygenase n=1 Tax=Aspergillus ochraceoroseus TaxID=138278 RepID=A0A0F8XR64_9EURO|nr:hypothetical protein AOCH_000445 [Aspergillus ochraceoroseus]